MKNREIVWLPEEDKDYVRSFVLDEDDDMMVFSKPAGLACQTIFVQANTDGRQFPM